MVADMERLENAARTAMGDYSVPVPQVPAPASLLRGRLDILVAAASRLSAVMGRPFGRTA